MAAGFKTTALERFLRYVAIDTQADDRSTSHPSTQGQLTLLKQLVEELKAVGVRDATLDEHGYVMATIPATTQKVHVPVIGFIAHVDTAPDMSGKDVKPIVHEHYDGHDLVLPDEPSAILTLADDPDLQSQLGHDIVTASGGTLLGADDKAGVAEIMAATEFLLAHPELPHGAVRIGFTPDEEIGRGTAFFDVSTFGATCAYTVDGGNQGELESESFSADAMTVTFQGFNTHPGYAKGRMINAIKVAADFIGRLPADTLSPETTDAYGGYVHPYQLDASVDRTSVKLLVRDFETAGLRDKAALLGRLAQDTVDAHPGARVELAVRRVVPEHETRARPASAGRRTCP